MSSKNLEKMKAIMRRQFVPSYFHKEFHNKIISRKRTHCLGRGHIASQCANKRTMIIKDNGEVEIEEESNNNLMSFLENDNEELSHDGDLLVVRKVLNMQEKGKDEAQRENIFNTRCLVQ
ncbi:hypothetical protein CR513_27429, partial [Mucuna pruriens]